jgi:hypothetical protein
MPPGYPRGSDGARHACAPDRTRDTTSSPEVVDPAQQGIGDCSGVGTIPPEAHGTLETRHQLRPVRLADGVHMERSGRRCTFFVALRGGSGRPALFRHGIAHDNILPGRNSHIAGLNGRSLREP